MARQSISLSPDRLRDWARTGAEATLNRLRAEIIAIERTFPELALPPKRRALSRSIKKAQKRASAISTAARQAVSARVKKYQAERRRARRKLK